MEAFAPRHLLMILLVVLLVFGTKKLRTVGSDLGAAVRDFKKSMREGESQPAVIPVRADGGAAEQSERRDV